MFEVDFYRLPDGSSPVQDFMDGMEKNMRAKSLSGIAALKQAGNTLREPFSRYIDDGVFELRIKVSTNISRIFYFFQSGKRIILTNGYVKKTQKMDRREFEKAVAYKKDYERSAKHG